MKRIYIIVLTIVVILGCKREETVRVFTEIDYEEIGSPVKLYIPEGYTHLADSLFFYDSRLEEVYIPEGVVSIGDRVFSGAGELRKVELPNSLKEIGEEAFYNCMSLERLVVPGGVEEIGWGAFPVLMNPVEIEGDNFVVHDGMLYDKGMTKLISACGLNESEEIILPLGLTHIGNDVFSSCVNLLRLEIPASVVYIGDWAFSGYSGNEIILPEGLKYIGEGVFAYSSVKSLKIPRAVEYIGDRVFIGSSAEIDVYADGFVVEGDFLYDKGKTRLISQIGVVGDDYLILPSTLKRIGNGAFGDCLGLISVDIPNGVEEIGTNAFYNCVSLEVVSFPSSVKVLGWGAFSRCLNLVTVSLPMGVSEIGRQMFYSCENLRTIIIPEGVEEIGESAFGNCMKLKSVILPSTLKELKDYCFYGTGLSRVVLPESLSFLGEEVFKGSDGLGEISVSEKNGDLLERLQSEYSEIVVSGY